MDSERSFIQRWRWQLLVVAVGALLLAAAWGITRFSAGPAANQFPGWTAYTDSVDGFSLHYPEEWYLNTCPAEVSSKIHTILLLARTEEALGSCESDYTGQMSVYAFDGDQRTVQALDETSYVNIKSSAVTVAGVKGSRQTALSAPRSAVAPQPNTETVRYIFFTNHRTYVATYLRTPHGALAADVEADFDKMVQQTLKFTL